MKPIDMVIHSLEREPEEWTDIGSNILMRHAPRCVAVWYGWLCPRINQPVRIRIGWRGAWRLNRAVRKWKRAATERGLAELTKALVAAEVPKP